MVQFGTIKSEIWSHMEESAQDYYRYEVITRWWKNEAGDGFEWKHTIIRIDRDGSVKRYEDFKEPDDWWDAYEKYMTDKPTSHSYDGYNSGRTMMVDQHHWIVRHCIA